MSMANKLILEGNLEAGLEVNIAVQKDPKFINDACAYIDELKNIYDKDTKVFKDTTTFLNISKQAKETLSNLSLLLSERFGIDFSIIGDSTGNACVFSVTPSNYNVIREDAGTIEQTLIDAIKYMREMSKMSGEKQEKEISMDSFSGIVKIYESMLSSTKSLDALLKTDSVKFDLLKAKVSGLPKDFKSIIAIDIVAFMQTHSIREILAIIIHEVGHQFTHLLNMYRIARTNTILKDCSILAKEGNIGKIEITLKKELGVEIPKLNNFKDEDNFKDIKVFMTTLLSKATTVNENESSYSSRDSEALADQFASKFGLSMELVTGLDKIIDNNYTELDYMLGEQTIMWILKMNIIISILFIVYCLCVMLIFGITISSTTIGIVLASTFSLFMEISIMALGVLVAINVYRFITGGNDAFEAVYDDKKRRLERIRNDAIRMLNSAILSADGKDKEMITNKISDIQALDKVIEKTRKNRAFVDIAGDFFFSSNRKHSIETLVQQLLEDMNANKLTMLGAKLEQL